MDGLFWRREGQESWYGQKNFYWPKTPMDQFTRDIPKIQWHRTEVSVEIRKFCQANNVPKNVNIGILILNKMDNMCMCIYVYIHTCTCVCGYIYTSIYIHTLNKYRLFLISHFHGTIMKTDLTQSLRTSRNKDQIIHLTKTVRWQQSTEVKTQQRNSN